MAKKVRVPFMSCGGWVLAGEVLVDVVFSHLPKPAIWGSVASMWVKRVRLFP